MGFSSDYTCSLGLKDLISPYFCLRPGRPEGKTGLDKVLTGGVRGQSDTLPLFSLARRASHFVPLQTVPQFDNCPVPDIESSALTVLPLSRVPGSLGVVITVGPRLCSVDTGGV